MIKVYKSETFHKPWVLEIDGTPIRGFNSRDAALEYLIAHKDCECLFSKET